MPTLNLSASWGQGAEAIILRPESKWSEPSTDETLQPTMPPISPNAIFCHLLSRSFYSVFSPCFHHRNTQSLSWLKNLQANKQKLCHLTSNSLPFPTQSFLFCSTKYFKILSILSIPFHLYVSAQQKLPPLSLLYSLLPWSQTRSFTVSILYHHPCLIWPLC